MMNLVFCFCDTPQPAQVVRMPKGGKSRLSQWYAVCQKSHMYDFERGCGMLVHLGDFPPAISQQSANRSARNFVDAAVIAAVASAVQSAVDAAVQGARDEDADTNAWIDAAISDAVDSTLLAIPRDTLRSARWDTHKKNSFIVTVKTHINNAQQTNSQEMFEPGQIARLIQASILRIIKKHFYTRALGLPSPYH